MHDLANALASAFLAGPWQEVELVHRGAWLLGGRRRWLRPLVRRVLEVFPRAPSPRRRLLANWLAANVKLRRIAHADDPDSPFVFWQPRPEFRRVMAEPWAFRIPMLETAGALAAWSGVSPSALDWFADCRSWEAIAPAGPLRHYHYRWIAKRGGAARLLEAPKQRLKLIQSRLLHGLLDHVPPHGAAHAFCVGRSVRSFVTPHVGRQVVVKLDLKDFFPSIPRSRVMSLFRALGYPEQVARPLAGICTNLAPADALDAHPGALAVAERRRLESLYGVPHLPQGAPTSPALANLCAYRLDSRLAGLARSAGATYTRYADDLVFSGDQSFARGAQRFSLHVAAIALEEGFEVNHRKTRIMRQSVRQRAAGIVLNERPNIARPDFDRLKAQLHNCIRHGPASQNRLRHADYRAHLLGRISYVASINSVRGQSLRELFDRISWQ